MSERFGKIKNGKLILAPMIINRNGSILYDEQELYIENGYKRIVYTTPPENLEEYNLVSRWVEKENSIIQKWEHVRIEDDYSFK